MDSFDTELELAVKELDAVPRRLSEANVKRLGTVNHFETFEDELHGGESSAPGAGGKRLSLSGSIIVLDLDFKSQSCISNVQLSLSQETKLTERSAFSKANNAESRILDSLREPRLDRFANLLAFLSRCDRLSTKDVNCFHALDVVAEAVQIHVSKTGTQAFGNLVLNPPDRLGLGLNYYKDMWAMIDTVAGSRDRFLLKNYNDITGWIDPDTGAWLEGGSANATSNSSIGSPASEIARSELALSLDPEVLLPLAQARELHAVISDPKPRLDSRTISASFSVNRHPRFSSSQQQSDEFTVIYGNMLPYKLVSVSQVPLGHPKDIPAIFSSIKKFTRVSSLLLSVLSGPACTEDEPADISVSDALALADHSVSRARVPLALSVYLDADSNEIVVDVKHVLSERRLQVLVGDTVKTVALPDPAEHSKEDIQSLVEGGRLDLAISYFLSTHGGLRRASSIVTDQQDGIMTY